MLMLFNYRNNYWRRPRRTLFLCLLPLLEAILSQLRLPQNLKRRKKNFKTTKKTTKKKTLRKAVKNKKVTKTRRTKTRSSKKTKRLRKLKLNLFRHFLTSTLNNPVG
jgi:hypothetical protein